MLLGDLIQSYDIDELISNNEDQSETPSDRQNLLDSERLDIDQK